MTTADQDFAQVYRSEVEVVRTQTLASQRGPRLGFEAIAALLILLVSFYGLYCAVNWACEKLTGQRREG